MRDTVQRLEVLVASLTSKKMCSAPDLCLELKPIVERNTATLNQGKGAWKMFILLAGAIGGLSGALVTLLISFLHH